MLKWIKYIFIFIVSIVFLPFVVLIGGGYLTIKLAKYLWAEKDKYEDIKDCFRSIKNIGALLAIIIGIIVVPTGLVKYSKFCIETAIQGQEEQSIENKKEEEEKKQRVYENARRKVLDPSYRISKEIDNVDSVEDTCILSKEEIQKYNITDEEISKFEKDRDKAIIEYKDKKTLKKFEKMAKEYVSDNTTSSIYNDSIHRKSKEYGFNEDKTEVTISGSYRGRTLQLVYIRCNYTIKFDTNTGDIIEADLGKEFIDRTKHPQE